MHHWQFSMVLGLVLLSGCARQVRDPIASLADGNGSVMKHRISMTMLEAAPRTDEAAVDALQGLIYRPGYEVDVRRRGMNLLIDIDRPTLVRTVRQRLPRITDKPWLRALCNWTSDQTWTPDERERLQEALISSWGRAWSGGMPEAQRPEYMALQTMAGQQYLDALVWNQLVSHDKPSEEGFRNRCWAVLHRLGARSMLVREVQTVNPDTESNPMLKDLHEAAVAFGTVPWNREEILWLRKLREPGRKAFWAQAATACAAMDQTRRAHLRIRDLPVAVAARRHRPDLAGADVDAMLVNVRLQLKGQRHYREQNAYYRDGAFVQDRLDDHASELTWGDAAAITLAMDALQVPQIVKHLFDYADRDSTDTTTEYGGVLSLDAEGRYELLEFPPRVRHHDLRFNAPQEMFDAAYTGLFHFHFHATSHRNRAHAGPGLGDLKYADETRANCLVMSFVDEDTLNVDWYRHDGVVVDLGCVQRPSAGRT